MNSKIDGKEECLNFLSLRRLSKRTTKKDLKNLNPLMQNVQKWSDTN